MKFSIKWAMPSKHTFTIRPIRDLLDRWIPQGAIVVDPFCGEAQYGTHNNDLGFGGVDAEEFCQHLITQEVSADVVLFDPPYSPRQMSECYRKVGINEGSKSTQNAALYKRVREPLRQLLRPGGIAISFGWSSSGFGNKWSTEEVLLVQHGGAHNDTICVVQRKPND